MGAASGATCAISGTKEYDGLCEADGERVLGRRHEGGGRRGSPDMVSRFKARSRGTATVRGSGQIVRKSFPPRVPRTWEVSGGRLNTQRAHAARKMAVRGKTRSGSISSLHCRRPGSGLVAKAGGG